MIKNPSDLLVRVTNLYFSLQVPVLLVGLLAIFFLYSVDEFKGFQATLYAVLVLGHAITATITWKIVYHLQSIDAKIVAANDHHDETVSSPDESNSEPEEAKQETTSWFNR